MLVPLDEMKLGDIAKQLEVEREECFKIAQYKKDNLERDISDGTDKEGINKIADNIINSPAESRKNVKGKTEASGGIKGIINQESAKVALVAGAAVAAIALLISNLPAVMVAGMGYLFGKEQIKKGR